MRHVSLPRLKYQICGMYTWSSVEKHKSMGPTDPLDLAQQMQYSVTKLKIVAVRLLPLP